MSGLHGICQLRSLSPKQANPRDKGAKWSLIHVTCDQGKTAGKHGMGIKMHQTSPSPPQKNPETGSNLENILIDSGEARLVFLEAIGVGMPWKDELEIQAQVMAEKARRAVTGSVFRFLNIWVTWWLHPRKPTRNPKIEVWKMIFLFKGMIFMFHVSFRGSNQPTPPPERRPYYQGSLTIGFPL